MLPGRPSPDEAERCAVGTEDTLLVLAELASRHHLSDLERRCRAAGLQAREGVLYVAVLGRFKAGKTTMLNQVLEADLLPVQVIPATAVITRVRFGPSCLATAKTRHREPQPIEVSQLPDWVTETGNPGNRRGVEWVEVTSPSLWDLANLVLVDTPGTGSTYGHNTETSLGWLPNVGAAVIAVNSTQPLAEEDLQLVELVQPHTPDVTIVLTKVDLLSDVELVEVSRHVRRQLGERLACVPPILPFSIAQRHGGYREQLREHLRQLDRSHAVAVAGLAEHRASQLATECRAYLELAAAAASTHEQEVVELRHALDAEAARLPALREQTRAQLQPIHRAIAAQAQQALNRELPLLVHGVARDLAHELPSWHGSLAAETARFREWLESALVAALTPVAGEAAGQLEPLVSQGLAPAKRMGEAFVQRLGRLVDTALGIELELPVPEPVQAPIEAVDVAVNAVFDSHLELLSWGIPMPVVRPLVHRHFERMVPWQVEKNLYRAAYRTAAAAIASIERSLDDYLQVLAELVHTHLYLLKETPDELLTLTSDLHTVDQLIHTLLTPATRNGTTGGGERGVLEHTASP